MEPLKSTDPFRKFEIIIENLTLQTKPFEFLEPTENLLRKLENRHTSTSTRRPPSPNELEAQKADTVSYRSKPNATLFSTPKTSKADQQAAETAKIFAKLAAQAAAIRRDNTEQKALHDARRAEILAEAAVTNHEFRSEMNALRVELALAELTLAEN